MSTRLGKHLLGSDEEPIGTTASGKRLHLRWADRCRLCSAKLAAGTEAEWDPGTRAVKCLSCASDGATVEPGQAGASALREYHHRHAAREEHARRRLGWVGVLLARVFEEPSSTRAWQQGGQGEVQAGRRLEQLLESTPVRLLHDRAVPGHARANIDHIAVGPAGVTVIDTKTHRGKIRRDWYGGLFADRRTILRIDGRDQTTLITSVEKQISYVRTALAKLDAGDEICVAGALCFPNVNGLPVFRRIEIRGILVDGPKPIASLATRPGPLDTETIEQIWAHLARASPLPDHPQGAITRLGSKAQRPLRRRSDRALGEGRAAKAIAQEPRFRSLKLGSQDDCPGVVRAGRRGSAAWKGRADRVVLWGEACPGVYVLGELRALFRG